MPWVGLSCGIHDRVDRDLLGRHANTWPDPRRSLPGSPRNRLARQDRSLKAFQGRQRNGM